MSQGQEVNLGDKKVFLNALEIQRAGVLEQMVNALGYEIPITTLTAITKSIVEQKFFTVPFADYLPVRVGQGAWSADLLTYLDFQIAGSFEDGIVNTGASNSRLAESDAGITSISVKTRKWAEQITYSIMDLQQAARAGNWDIVTSKERSRKRSWDLGIQSVAFLGLKSDSNVLGLLTQPDVTSNTALITQYISAMNYTDFSTFVAGVIAAYRTNCNFTAMPTHFIIPELDYNGLTVPVNPAFPINSKLEYLQKAFEVSTGNKNFRILPLAYAGEAINAAYPGLNKNRYTLLNYDEDSLRMDLPVDYTNTLANTINGFQFQNVGYGQFTGAKAYRPLEMLYFDFA